MSQPLSKPPLAAVFSLLFICSFCLYVAHCSYSHLDFTHLVCVDSRYFVKFKPTFSLNTNQRHTTHRFLCPGRTNVLSRPEQDSGVSWCSGPSEPAPLKTRHRLPTVKEQEARPKGLSKSVGQSSHDHVDPQPRPLLNLSVYVSFVTSMHTVSYCVVALNLRSLLMFSLSLCPIHPLRLCHGLFTRPRSNMNELHGLS